MYLFDLELLILGGRDKPVLEARADKYIKIRAS